jgi:hypothetical protein
MARSAAQRRIRDPLIVVGSTFRNHLHGQQSSLMKMIGVA